MAINNKDYKAYGPFKLWTIENFPFIEEDFDAITNYQLWCKIVENMKKLIENQTTLEISQKEVINAFNELEKYVNDYFDNLDLQEEVNNKLDEMAESGELADIIAQYLDLASVLAFNTILDLHNAENLSNGSIAYVLGENSYNDGKGAFYKIRLVTTSDVIDEFNIVSIPADNTIVGERITNYYINEINDNINNIEENIDNIDLNINNIKKELNANNLYLGVFFNANEGNKIYLKVSKDGKKFINLPMTANLTGRDPSIVYFNNKFYIAVTNFSSSHDFIIYSSEDLINFETHYINVNLNNYLNRWAPELFIDNNQLKVFISLQLNSSSNFNIYSLDCTDIENLTFSNLTNITPAQETSCIDASITKYNNGYYMVVTDVTDSANEVEISKIYYSTDLLNWSLINNNIFKTCYNVEGCQLLYINGKWNIYGDSPLLAPYLLIQTDNLANTDRAGNNISDYIQPLRTLTNMRHGSLLYINNENLKNIIYNIIDENDFNINYEESENKITVLKELSNSTIDKFIIQPNTIFHIGGATSTITKLYNPFRTDKFAIVFFTSVQYGQVTFSQIQNNQGGTINANINYHDSNDIHQKMFYQSMEQNCTKTYIP